MTKKSKKLKIKKLQINLTNRWLYTLIAFFSLIIIGIFVYAIAPNPGHEITEIAPPDTCSADQYLQWDGSDWTCADAGGGLWTLSGSNIYPSNLSHKVGIGTSSPLQKLYVEGSAYISGHLGIGELAEAYPLQVDGVAEADTFRAFQFIGGGEGLTNLRVLVTPSGDTCDETTHGLLKYRNETCTYDDTMSSYLEVCMRQANTTYDWYTVKKYDWEDEICDDDGCPGQTYFNCVGGLDCPEPGCYDSEPEDCFDCEPAQV